MSSLSYPPFPAIHLYSSANSSKSIRGRTDTFLAEASLSARIQYVFSTDQAESLPINRYVILALIPHFPNSLIKSRCHVLKSNAPSHTFPTSYSLRSLRAHLTSHFAQNPRQEIPTSPSVLRVIQRSSCSASVYNISYAYFSSPRTGTYKTFGGLACLSHRSLYLVVNCCSIITGPCRFYFSFLRRIASSETSLSSAA
jgi:hypothetical protein